MGITASKRISAWVRRQVHRNNTIQHEASAVSLQRFFWSVWIIVPIHLIFAWWFAHYRNPLGLDHIADWGASRSFAQATAAILVSLTAILIWQSRSTGWTAPKAIGLQVFVGQAYMGFGAVLSVMDLRAGLGAGVASFMMISMSVGVFSIARPAITVPMFLVGHFVFLHLLHMSGIEKEQQTFHAGLAAVVTLLSLCAAIVNWQQFVQTVLFRRKLQSTNASLVRKQNKMQYLVIHDSLTELINRREMERLVRAELARAARSKLSTSVAMIDVDHFKKVNDVHGHPVGDKVLQAVAKTVGASVRDTDVVARLGGEEFMVLLPNTDYEGANKVAEKIRLAFDDQSIIEDPLILNITVSIGVCATGERLNATMEKIYSLADKALYQAKQDGRNCVRDSSLAHWDEYG